MNKILIVGPAWVGDMVMAQSLFKLLKERRPGVIIHVAAPAWTLPLLTRMPEVSAVTALPFVHGRLDLRARYAIGKKLASEQFSQAIVLPNSFKSALIPWFANIPVRTGWSRELRSLIMNDSRSLDKKRYPLMVPRFLALGLAPEEAVPAVYAYPELKSEFKTQAAALQRLGLQTPPTPVLALCPGAEFGPSKRWPEEAFAEVARAKLAAGWQVWLFGSAKDQAVTERIMALTNQACLDLAGKTSLDEAIDLLALTTAVVSNDSGLMHVAAALQKPVIAIYGSTSPGFTPPLAEKVAILKLSLACQPCFKRECPLQHHRCMRDLAPASVLNSLEELVAA
ncbi:MAG TPA: lipopolysaccharide heptosyltransferase II [Gammaproteobacteria bacterium]|nr:lipopolysaccharide heptosyltransferase II [Gammaproteobacteria bacterium]